MVRLRAICCSTVTRAAAFCSDPVEPTSASPGSTRKRVMPNSRSSRPPSWLEMASERMAEALEVPLPEVPPLRAVDSDVVCPKASKVMISSVGKGDRKSTRLNSSHSQISYAVFCLKKKKKERHNIRH